MCGIAGRINFDPYLPVDETVMRRMIGVLAHRGPDGEGVRIDGSVGLGHRRLAIIDLSPAGDQPMCNEDATIWIVFNGEIYNHLELRAQLESRGHRYRSKTDTESILHLYEEYGRGCVSHLRGMFAFALWDSNKRTLLLARDRFGQKPLLYAETSQGIVFASELKAILQDSSVPDEIDDIALHQYLTYGYIPAPRTIFRSIRKLPAASTLMWRAGRPAVDRYWRLSYTPKLEISVDEAAEQVLHLLREATRLRLMSDVPLGALLSGGIDSSAVVAMMAEELSSPVKTFSVGFEEGSYNETPYARDIAARFQTDHHEFFIRPAAVDVLPELVWAYGEPFADSSALPSYYVAKMTRQHVTVALNGDGGDEAFAGYDRYLANQLSESYQRIPAWARRRVLEPMARGIHESTRRKDALRRFKRFVLAQRSDPFERYLNWVLMMDEDIKRSIYTRDFHARTAAINSSAEIEEAFHAADGSETLDRLLFADVQMYLPDDLLVKIDVATMIQALEARSPFLDHQFAEFVARLPANFKLRGRDGKFILKKALRGILPRRILKRGKYGFSVPVGKWFRSELVNVVLDVITDPMTMKRGIFKPDGLRRLVDEHVSGRFNHGNRIWQLLMLELWFRTYKDRSRSELKGPAEGILPTSERAVV